MGLSSPYGRPARPCAKCGELVDDAPKSWKKDRIRCLRCDRLEHARSHANLCYRIAEERFEENNETKDTHAEQVHVMMGPLGSYNHAAESALLASFLERDPLASEKWLRFAKHCMRRSVRLTIQLQRLLSQVPDAPLTMRTVRHLTLVELRE